MSSTSRNYYLSVILSVTLPVFQFPYRSFVSFVGSGSRWNSLLSQIVRIHSETCNSHILVTTYLTHDPKTVSILHIPAYNFSFGNIR